MAAGRTHIPGGVEEKANGGNVADGLLPETGKSVGKWVSI
jgi:hypothetical protein